MNFGFGLVLNVGYACLDGVARWGTAPMTAFTLLLTVLVWPAVIRLRHHATFGQSLLILLAMFLILMGILVVVAVVAAAVVLRIALMFRRT